MVHEERQGLYRYAECAAGGEELLLLIFGHGAKPETTKKSDARYNNVKDNGDGTWTAELRQAKIAPAKSFVVEQDLMASGKADDKSVAESVRDACVRSVSSREYEDAKSLDLMSLSQLSTNRELGEAPVVEDPAVLVADFGSISADCIDKIVVASPTSEQDLSVFYKQGDHFHEARPQAFYDDDVKAFRPGTVSVREFDTFRFGVVQAFVLESETEASVFNQVPFTFDTYEVTQDPARNPVLDLGSLAEPSPTLRSPSVNARVAPSDPLDMFRDNVSLVSVQSQKSLDFFTVERTTVPVMDGRLNLNVSNRSTLNSIPAY